MDKRGKETGDDDQRQAKSGYEKEGKIETTKEANHYLGSHKEKEKSSNKPFSLKTIFKSIGPGLILEHQTTIPLVLLHIHKQEQNLDMASYGWQ